MPEISTEAQDDQAASRYDYRFGPFHFLSELAIAELREAGGGGEREVNIRMGGVPQAIPGGLPYGRFCQVAPAAYLLNIPGVARFFVSDGELVRVEPDANAPAGDLSVYLLGSVFGALCHQNGLLPLHASSVEAGGGVTAFLGDSGAGKSTLAACLERRGYRIVSDDICVLEGAQVIPVAGWLKLWRASLDHLGETPDERNRVYSAEDKYRLYLPATGAERPALANLVFLTRAAEADARPVLVALSAAEAIAQMLRLTYLGYITELTRSHARVFRQCAQVLAGARAYRLTAPWALERMDDVLDLLEAELPKTASAPQ
jgi:hypothetical protein